jgi:DNA-binding MarR family transcriptional regulator
LTDPGKAPPPMIGALLRGVWQEVRTRIHAELHAAGFDDVRKRDLQVLQWPGPDGLRAIDLATNAGVSKQAIKPLVEHLESCGYLTREPDPNDHRAQRLRTTARGSRLLAEIRKIGGRIEAELAERIGPQRYENMRDALQDLRGP